MLYQWDFRSYQRRFRQALQTCHGSWSLREGILLRLVDETGNVGWGEIAPIPWFGSETFEQAWAFCHQLPSELSHELIFAIPDALPSCQVAFESAWEGVGGQAMGKIAPLRRGGAESGVLFAAGSLTLRDQSSIVPVQSSIVPVQDSIVPVQDSIVAVQSSIVPVQDSIVAVQSSNISVQDSIVPVQDSIVAVQSSNIPVQNSMVPVQGSDVAVQSSIVPVQSSIVPVQNSNAETQTSKLSSEAAQSATQNSKLFSTPLILHPSSFIPHPSSPTPHLSLPHSALLPPGTAALYAWKPLWEQGFRTFKWKIGVQAIATELELLHRLTQTLPPAAKLRLDANGGLNLDDAARWLAMCDAIAADPNLPVALEYIEQPLDVSQFQAMQDLSCCYRTPIALDESVAQLQQLQTCYDNGWRGIFVIKPAIVGSPTRLRQFCQDHPIDAVFSCALETAIGRQAGLRLAATLGNPDRAMGYGTTHWFDAAEIDDFEQLWQTL